MPHEPGGVHGRGGREDIRTIIFSVEEALAAADHGAVVNIMAQVALLWFARHGEALRQRWLGPAIRSDRKRGTLPNRPARVRASATQACTIALGSPSESGPRADVREGRSTHDDSLQTFAKCGRTSLADEFF